MPPLTGTLLIPRDLGAQWDLQQHEELALRLEERLTQPVALALPEDPNHSLPAALESLVNKGVTDLVLLPLGLLSLPAQGRIRQSLDWARRKWPALTIRVAPPLTLLDWAAWLRRSALDAARELMLDPDRTAALLVGQGSADPLTNSNLARLTHLLHEPGPFPTVKYAFLYGVRPDIPEQIDATIRAGLKDLLVIPWLLGAGEMQQQLRQELKRVTQGYNLNAQILSLNLSHPSLINVLVSNHYSAVADESLTTTTTPPSDQLTESEKVELQELEQRINALLPSEYKGRYDEVQPKSMGTAKLKYDAEGKIAWDEIWTSFCDLALAGGPPHRGSLLEAVTSEQARAEPEKYQAVVAEIERGIRMVTGLPLVTGTIPGWVGVRCQSEEMAVWLMRAVIVENVMVRREADILYLPAGPHFRPEKEIKNVITSLAKTTHYYSAHLKSKP